MVEGETIGIDATTLEANVALRSIVRRDSGETYRDFLPKLAQALGYREADARRPWRELIASGRRKGGTTTGLIRMILTRRAQR